MFRRLLLGLIKGLLVGGAVGALLHFGLAQHALTISWINYLLYGVVAALAGVVAGQPPWRQGAWIASVLKALVGFGVGAGLFALVSHFLKLPVGGIVDVPAGTALAHAPLFFAPVVATVYAALVELDDGGESAPEAATGVRVASGRGAEVQADEIEAEQKKSSGRARR